MQSIQEDMEELRKQIVNGSVQRAYRTLLSYMMGLRTHFANKYGDAAVSALYQGYMDMTYFALFPASLRERDLKIAIVFNYDTFRFEAWLSGRNRKIQRQYWEAFKDSRWDEYRVVAPAGGIDSILECDLARDFDLGDPEGLTARIEKITAAFIKDIEKFLSGQRPDTA
jgi:hypothetical protein